MTIKGSIGGLRLRECTTSRIDRLLKEVAANHPAKAKTMKVALTGMLSMAVRHDAIATNPVREVGKLQSAPHEVRAITLDELKALREHVRLWQTGAAMEGREPRQIGGQKRTQGLLDVVDILLATGARPGEVLAMRWADLDLAASPPRLTITGTIVRVKGEGLVRQAHPKTHAGRRSVMLPMFAVETMMRVKMNATANDFDVIFPSSTGTLRDPHNLGRQWRDARGETFKWVTPRSFRKTVATLIDRESSAKDAASQLGHSGTAVTERHYIERTYEAPDLTRVLDQLADQA
ncbi:site-specific integrase [Rhodococcus marinonascens]|uniref:site-specific integrase n=1 Tax=Rhodococcus marinonascens TaxID=38311 RepID=UPI0014738B73|nr:tyrosine-type recombinase/integrase [Rhodococcus marinonascens]